MWVAIIGVSLLLSLQLVPVLLARGARGRQVPELAPFLSPEQRRQSRLLVYFWSPTCALCRPMSRALDGVASSQVVRINVMEAPQVAAAFRVMGTPSLAVVDAGVITELQVGARSEPQLRALLQSST